MEIYKDILNTIAKPIITLNEFEMGGVIARLSKGSMADKRCAESLDRLSRYIDLTLQLAKEQREAWSRIKDDLLEEVKKSE